MCCVFTLNRSSNTTHIQTDLVQYPKDGEESDYGDTGRREKELSGRKPVSQQKCRREEVKLGLRTVERVPAFLIWNYRRSRLQWHQLQWHNIGPSGYSDTFLMSQFPNLIVKFSCLQWHSIRHLLTVTLFGSSRGCHCNRLPLYCI